MDILEEYMKNHTDKKYVVEGNKLFLVLAVIAVGLERKEFLKATSEFVEKCKTSPSFQDKKLFVFGTVKGVERNQIWITKPVGTIACTLKPKDTYTWTGIINKLFKLFKS